MHYNRTTYRPAVLKLRAMKFDTSTAQTHANDLLPILNAQVMEKLLKKNFMAPFNGWGSTASRLQPLPGGSLLFTTQFPEIPLE